MKIKSVIFSLFVATLSVIAGTTGKIVGIVTDFENGEPLPGVNVFVDGTGLGASTDNDGMYIILNVPPGTYTLKMNYVGYADYEVDDVKVSIDLTTRVDAGMKSQILLGETVVVTAVRPIVQRDISNSQMNIEAKAIASLPVSRVDEVVTLQAGIETGSRGLIVRGGGANQTVFMLDGMAVNDERSNYPYSTFSLSSVQEIQVQTGGFSAEYADARSGVINFISKEGNRQAFSGSANIQIAPAAPKHFGPSLYDPYSFFNRPYMDPEVMWTGTGNGAWDSYTRKQYPNFQGWNAVSEALLQDSDPDNDLTPAAAARLYAWQHRRQGDIKKPDYVIDLGFGGPLPGLSEQLGNARFYASYFNERDMFVFPLSRDNYGANHAQLKLTADIDPSLKVNLTGWYGEVHSVSPYDWTTTPTGYLLRGTSTVANYANSNTIVYMPGYYSPGSVYRYMIGLKLTKTLDRNSLYETRIQYRHSYYNTYQKSFRDTSRIYEVIPGYYTDEAPYGYWGYGVNNPIEGLNLGGWMNLGRDKTRNSTFSLNFDYTNQINANNQIKTGLHVVMHNYDINSGTFSPSMSTWTRSMIYNVKPYRIGAYLQDKLEYEGFIANLGVRLDYSNANSKVYDLSAYDDFFREGNGNQIEEQAPTRDPEAAWHISPRLGVSHPVTESSKIYFNYGHYTSEPFSSYRFRLQRESNGLVTYMGNPNLELERTISYELGYEQNIADLFLLKLAGYYKDVTNQPGWIYYQSIVSSEVQYYKAANNNYEDIRGFEITLSKHAGRWVSGFVNYTYDVRTSGYFGLLRYYQDPNLQRDYLRQNPAQFRTHPLPYANASIRFFTPPDFGPKWMGLQPFSDWSLHFLARWKTGAYETYNPDDLPGIVDNVQWRDSYNVDLRLMKSLRLAGYDFQFYLDIKNLFNFKEMDYAGFSSYRDDYLPYLQSLHFSWEKGTENGNDRVGDYRAPGVAYDPMEPNPNNDPEIAARNDRRRETKSYIDMPNIRALTFLNPRRYTFGLRISF